jgi:hypothetical protein
MDFTRSDAYVIHPGSGQRMHQGDQPVTTAVTPNDMNMVIWSLMAIVKAAGLPGVEFDENDPATYQRLLQAMFGLFGSGENQVLSLRDPAISADPTAEADATVKMTDAFAAGPHIRAPKGQYLISQVKQPTYSMLEGDGPYTTRFWVTKATAPGAVNRGIYQREFTEGESGIVMRDFSMEAKDWSGATGRHSYGVNLANVAHAMLENVHVTGFVRGFNFEDALISTGIRLRAHANQYGMVIEGNEPPDLGGSPGASKIAIYDFKCTSNGTAANGGAGLLLKGVSSYQNVFINPDFEFNNISIDNQGSTDAPHVFFAPYFETKSDSVDNRGLIRTSANTLTCMAYPAFGNTGPGQAAYYFDPAHHEGFVDIFRGHPNSQATRVMPPRFGNYEMVGRNSHDVIGTSIMSMIDFRKQYFPSVQGGAVIAGSSIEAYIYGALATEGQSVRNTFEANPNDPSNWTAGSGTVGQADPIGGTSAVQLTGNFQMLRSVGAATGKVSYQVFAKVITDIPGEVEIQYWNNGIMRASRVCSFCQKSDWMLLQDGLDLTGLASLSNTHEMRIVGGAGKLRIWWPQLAQGTDRAQPILPIDSGGPFGVGQGLEPVFSLPVRKVGPTAYELPQIVERLKFSGVAATAVAFPVLVDAAAPSFGRVFELIVRESYSGNGVSTVYIVAFSYGLSCSTPASIRQVSQALFGSGGASRCTPTVSAGSANANKSVILTTSAACDVEATIREVT